MERTFKDEEIMTVTDMLSAGHYARHTLVLDWGHDCWLENSETEKEYLDMLAGYSAVIFGRSGEYYNRLLQALIDQARHLTLVSGSYYTEPYVQFCRKITHFCSMRRVLAMNTGAEAVETAMKIGKRWAYLKKGVYEGEAEIISCRNNFHGRTQGVLSLSTNESHRKYFGPFLPGCKSVPFGDIKRLEEAITKNTAAFIVEPVQGEGGINVPPKGYLKEAQELCRNHNVLFILDEIQTGFGRTGTMFAHQADEVRPDKNTILILGKALGGGILPISAVLASDEVMGVLNPGSHGSTFGGNPLACAVACEVMDILKEDPGFVYGAREVGEYFLGELKKIKSNRIKEVRGRGLLVGIELYLSSADYFCEKLLEEGIICAVTHGDVLRFSPPLSITKKEIDWALPRIRKVLEAV